MIFFWLRNLDLRFKKIHKAYAGKSIECLYKYMLKYDLPRFSRTKKEAQLDSKNMDNLLFDILYLNISECLKVF